MLIYFKGIAAPNDTPVYTISLMLHLPKSRVILQILMFMVLCWTDWRVPPFWETGHRLRGHVQVQSLGTGSQHYCIF